MFDKTSLQLELELLYRVKNTFEKVIEMKKDIKIYISISEKGIYVMLVIKNSLFKSYLEQHMVQGLRGVYFLKKLLACLLTKQDLWVRF